MLSHKLVVNFSNTQILEQALYFNDAFRHESKNAILFQGSGSSERDTNNAMCIEKSATCTSPELTEPISSQDDLHPYAQRYEDSLTRITDGFAILTPEGIVLDMHQPSFLDDMSVQRKEVIGKYLADIP